MQSKQNFSFEELNKQFEQGMLQGFEIAFYFALMHIENVLTRNGVNEDVVSLIVSDLIERQKRYQGFNLEFQKSVRMLKEDFDEVIRNSKSLTKTNVEAFFDDVTENMLQFFRGWDTHVSHPSEKGGVRERRIKNFLSQYLPRQYGIASGHIIDRHKKQSLQEDIVIFDQLKCPVLAIDDFYQVFPCETVYATVEVKSTLDPKTISECIDHTEKLHQLDRGELNPIESFVFAYDSYKSKKISPAIWVRNKFQEMASLDGRQRPLPSVVVCLKHHFVLYFKHPVSELIPRETEDALLYFLECVLDRVQTVQTRTPQLFREYGFSSPMILPDSANWFSTNRK